MWALQALQGRAEVTFMTASAMNWDALNAAYGTSVDPRRIRLLRTTKLPGVRSGAQFVHWQRAYFERQCRRASRGFDVCVSAYNPIDFGRPGIQLLGDFSFSESMRRRLYDANDEPFYHRQSLIRRLYLATGECLRGLGRPALAERGDLAVANSEWSANLLAKYFGVLDAPVLYPPVTLSGPGKTDAPAPAAGAPVERGPFAFACLGRIAPEKEIETVIAILDRVRNAGYPVTLDVIGQFDGGAYSDQIRRLTEARKDWIRTPGFLNSEEKKSLLRSTSFGLHACRIEAFGIAVAEMAAAGCVPLVPGTGGAGEIVRRRELQFRGVGEGAEKIVALLENPRRVRELRRELTQSTDRFGTEVFCREFHRIFYSFLAGRTAARETAAAPGERTLARHVEEAKPATV